MSIYFRTGCRSDRTPRAVMLLTCCLTLGTSLLPAAAAEPALVRAILSDNGDNDGFADTNETVSMLIVARNPGSEDLTGVVARLTADEPSVSCITVPEIALGDIPAGQSVTSSGAFVFKVAGDIERAAPFDELTTAFNVTFSSDQSGAPSQPQSFELDLDLDLTGGANLSSYFEGFESATGLAGFTTMNLDLGRSSNAASDGYRCQYNDPDMINSNSYGAITDCFLGATPAQADAYFWQIEGPESAAGSRSFSGSRSLYMGIILDAALGHTTPMATLESVSAQDPINLAYGRVCSATRTTACVEDVDCPPTESCVAVSPTLSFKHQVSLMDIRSVNAQPGESADRAVVHVQLADASGAAVGVWRKIEPYLNVYDQQGTDNYSNCMFDPVDDGNDEEDFFDPLDPDRRLGPSSTCFPEFSFVYLGDTDEPFDASALGNAEGPGLPGATGPGTWVESRFDLSRFQGRRLRLRFLSTSLKAGTAESYEQIFQYNPDPGDDGWWIDDVIVSDTLAVPAGVQVDVKDNSGLPGSLIDIDGDGLFDPCDNCPDQFNPEQVDGDGDLAGDVCDACPDEFVNDADADGFCCPDDNCCLDPNPDQLDGDNDGVGDPCDVDPVVVVSSDVADDPDYSSLQDAVDSAFQSGTRVRILPGDDTLGPYGGVTVSRNMLFHFEGVDDGSGRPVIVDGAGSNGFDINSSLGTAPTTLRNLTVRGINGVQSSVPTRIEDCTFDSATVTAVDLQSGDHELRRLVIKTPQVNRGVWIREFASATIVGIRVEALSGRGIRNGGSTQISNALIAGCLDGIQVNQGSLELRHSTITQNSKGIDRTAGSVSIANSIVHGNTADLAGGPDCSEISWSDIGTTDCSAVNDNLSLDPVFIAGFKLDKTSPAIDHGPHPSTYAGDPRKDLDGGPRLRDFGGSGLARIDIGAFEKENTALVPGDVPGLRFEGPSVLRWDAEPAAAQYHVYRDALSNLSFASFGVCRDDLDADRTDLTLTDAAAPPAGTGWFYEISAESVGGLEGTLGIGSSAERSNYAPCP